MMLPSLDVSPDEDRDYLVDMIRQLANLARSAGEVETEILLRAILDIMRARTRQPADQHRVVAG